MGDVDNLGMMTEIETAQNWGHPVIGYLVWDFVTVFAHSDSIMDTHDRATTGLFGVGVIGNYSSLKRCDFEGQNLLVAGDD